MAQMMSKMGCHRRLLFGSPAKSLGLRVCHSFCTCVRQSLSSLQHPEPEKAFSVSFHSVQPLPNSHNKSVCFLVPQHFTHLFSHLLHAVSVIPLRSISSTASATHTCRWYHFTQYLSQAPFNQPQVLSTQSNATKNMRQTLVHTAEVAGCPVPVHFLLSPSLNSQSARDVPVVPPFTCFTAS